MFQILAERRGFETASSLKVFEPPLNICKYIFQQVVPTSHTNPKICIYDNKNSKHINTNETYRKRRGKRLHKE
jgi:hypothetical protein